MKNNFPVILLLTFISIFLFSCKKKEKPVVETVGLTNVTTTSARCDGKVTSNGSDAIISCGACWSKDANPSTDDSKTSDNSGLADFSSTINNLDAGTVYYARAYATNSAGTGYGTIISFKTLGEIPSAELSPAGSLTATSAKLSAIVNPHYVSTAISFEYGISSSYGASVSALQSPVSGNSDVSVTADISGLLPGTTYHYRVKAVNSVGTTYSSDLTFTTLGSAPTVYTPTSSNLTTSSVTVYSGVNANYVSTTVTFEYGTTTEYGSSVPAAQSPLTGNYTAQVSATISSLSPGTLYHIRVKTQNSLGVTYSNDLIITTLGQAPTASTSAATNITTTAARLNGIINPKYLTTSGTFEYGKTTDYGSTVSVTPNPGSGNYNVSVYANITGLEPGTVYHFRITAVNSLGSANGTDLTFSTGGHSPTATTLPATQLMTNSTYLNGSVNPNNLSTTVSFEYGITNTLGSSVSAVPGTLTGSTAASVSSKLTGLSDGVTYYFRVKAENSLGITYGDILTFVPSAPPTSVTDVDGNVYSVIQVGLQYWMGENLKTTKYNDNASIPNVTDGTAWVGLTSPAYCWYENDAASYKNTYGALYNFYAVSTGKLCPAGWHVPSDAEFTTFTNSLGDINYAGGKIKEAGNGHWLSPNTGATNETGFTALPAGYITDQGTTTGTFSGIGKYEAWWTSTPYNEVKPWYRSVGYQTSAVEVRNGQINQSGFSVRCIKD